MPKTAKASVTMTVEPLAQQHIMDSRSIHLGGTTPYNDAPD